MEQKIYIPDLKAGRVIDFCNEERDFSDIEKVVFDYSYMSNFEPFGMLMISSKIREIKREFPHVTYYTSGHRNHDYAGHMGYFKSAGQPFGKQPGEATGSNNYIPINYLEVKELRKQSYLHAEEVQDTIVRKSEELSRVLSQGNDSLNEILSYSIRELMRNIVEHSDSKSIWFAAQAWPSKDLVEIAILDEGVGVPQALSVNPNLELDDHEDALLLAIEPGISGRAFKHNGKMRKQRGSVWDNSGYGLYVTSEICQLGGSFIICSGNSSMTYKNNQSIFNETTFNGTAIRLRLDISSISEMGPTLINSVVEKGEKKAEKNSAISNVRASKVSRLM